MIFSTLLALATACTSPKPTPDSSDTSTADSSDTSPPVETTDTYDTSDTESTSSIPTYTLSDFSVTTLWGSFKHEGLGAFFDVRDIDGDGSLDLVIAAPYAGDFEWSLQGAMEYFWGKNINYYEENFSSGIREEDEYYDGHMPEQVALVDVNGDGFLEIVYSTPYDGDGEGRLCIQPGSEFPDFEDEVCFFGGDIEGELASGFGLALRNAGDTNNDGYEDFLVSAPYADTVYLVLGGADLTHLKAGTLRSPEESFSFGACFTVLGDINGDGSTEIVVSNPFAEKAYVISLPSSDSQWVSTHYILELADEDSGSIQLTYQGISDLYNMAYSTPTKNVDLNGNGMADLMVTSTRINKPGSVFVFKDVANAITDGLATQTTDDADLLIQGIYNKESLGYADGMAVGDFNDDGYPDLALASRGEINDHKYPGAVYVFLGNDKFDFITETSSRMDLDLSQASFVINTESDEALPIYYGDFPITSLRAEDMDGDGVDDLLIGYPAKSRTVYYADESDEEDDEGTRVGAVFILHGGLGAFAS